MAAALSTQVVLLIKEIFLPQSMQHLSSDGGGHTLTTPVKSQQTDSEVFNFICMYSYRVFVLLVPPKKF